MKKYKSPIFKHIHQEAMDRFKAGAISADEMRRYDSSCLVSEGIVSASPVTHTPTLTATSSKQRG
ncbi:XRE family transcriptional regulator [Breznakiellaceae bacterium SP9]